MNSKYIKSLAALLALTPLALSAQNTYSGYFLDNYDYRYQMNPSYGNDQNFVSFPVIGNLNTRVSGTLHLKSVIYDVNGKTCLFTNPAIDAADAMSKFKDNNRIDLGVKVPIMSAGFKSWGGYNTVSINANVNVGANVPKSILSLAKEGVSNNTYDISDFKAHGIGYGEIALGHSRDIKQVPGLRVGATVKFLIGIANVDAKFNKANLSLGENDWNAVTNAEVKANIGGWQYETDYDKNSKRDYVSGVNLDGDGSIGPNGFGVAFDFGAEYQWNDFKFSFAALDLGFINFSKTQIASTEGDRTFNTDAYIFNANGDAENSFKNEWKRMRTGLSELYQLSDLGEQGSLTQGLGATLNFGIDYALPYYRKLHFGLLNSTRINGPYSWTQFRLSANIAPVKAFSADVNVATGTFGSSFGWMLNVHTTGFNFFVGMDHTVGKLAKQFVPLSSNAEFALGINFPF
ncbi:MAG: DUF5723 family protein [Prevotella sp.]|nr:DUF5723 family protein [Bacteroides sp.]MCM1366365.1 DUF5723 family protein [Prevotella sp.]MCM1436277.1 DUF5723 family protein [Prevotella sp.]